jgi:plastocyanin
MQLMSRNFPMILVATLALSACQGVSPLQQQTTHGLSKSSGSGLAESNVAIVEVGGVPGIIGFNGHVPFAIEVEALIPGPVTVPSTVPIVMPTPSVSAVPVVILPSPAPVVMPSAAPSVAPTTAPTPMPSPSVAPTIAPTPMPAPSEAPTMPPITVPAPTETPAAPPVVTLPPTPTVPPVVVTLPPTPAPVVASAAVMVRDFEMAPASLTVPVGTTVVFTFQGAPHSVTSDVGAPAAFDSGILMAGATFSQTFTMPGTYTYACIVHPQMKGTIIVQ